MGNRKAEEYTFSKKMEWAERLKAEYSKIAEANARANLTNVPSVTGVTVGRTDQKVAEQVGLGSYGTLRKAEYKKEHADEELIHIGY